MFILEQKKLKILIIHIFQIVIYAVSEKLKIYILHYIACGFTSILCYKTFSIKTNTSSLFGMPAAVAPARVFSRTTRVPAARAEPAPMNRDWERKPLAICLEGRRSPTLYQNQTSHIELFAPFIFVTL